MIIHPLSPSGGGWGRKTNIFSYLAYCNLYTSPYPLQRGIADAQFKICQSKIINEDLLKDEE